jgi:nucleoside 2-deoxyribosyltransferase
MTKPMIYLAGPMSGLPAHHANGWRKVVAEQLSDITRCLNPTRGLPFAGILPKVDDASPLSMAPGVVGRDRWDIERSDLVLANFLGAKVPSVGTIFELGWADAYRVPVVLVMEDEGNPHDHPMVTHTAAFRVNNIPDAIQVVRDVL